MTHPRISLPSFPVFLSTLLLAFAATLFSSYSLSAQCTPLSSPAPIISGPDSVCENSCGHIYSTPFFSGNSYNWSIDPNGQIISGQGTNQIDVCWDTTGIYPVMVTETNPSGCDSTIDFGVTVLASPYPVISGPDTVRSGDTSLYCIAPTLNNIEWSWTNTDTMGTFLGPNDSICVYVIWDDVTTIDSASLFVTESVQNGSFSCPGTGFPDPIIILPACPELSIIGSDQVCENSCGNLYTSTSMNFGSTYTWSVLGGVIISGQFSNIIEVCWGTWGAGFIYLIETNQFGCESTADIDVTVNPNPSPIIIGFPSVCEYSCSNFYTTQFWEMGSTYNWSILGGTIISGQGTNVLEECWDAAGVGEIQLTETNLAGCQTTVDLTVFVDPKPNPMPTGPYVVCENSCGNIYATPTVGAHGYNWTVSGGVIISPAISGAIEVCWGAAGAGQVWVNEFDGVTGCDTTETFQVIVEPALSPIISGQDTVCELSCGNTYNTPMQLGSIYNWNVTGGVVSSGQGTNSIEVCWGNQGFGMLALTETNVSGCDTTVVLSVNVYPKPSPVITGPGDVCEFSCGHIYNTLMNPLSTYNWSITGGGVNWGQGTGAIEICWDAAGIGTVMVTETNFYGCDSTVFLYVNVSPGPNPSSIAGPDTVCENSCGYSYITPINPVSDYNWGITGGSISSGQGTNAIEVCWDSPGWGFLEVTETNIATGCDTTKYDTISILSIPAPVISGSSIVCENRCVDIFTITPTLPGNSLIDWEVIGGTVGSPNGDDTLLVCFGSVGSGQVIVHETNGISGCNSSDTFNVTILDAPDPVISGNDTVCAFAPNQSYCTPPSMNPMSWTVVNVNGTIISDPSLNCITVVWGVSGIGVLAIEEINPVTGCTTEVYDTILIQPNPVPIISGLDTVCENTCGNIYSTPFILGNSYNWSIDPNGQIISGQGTNQIDVCWDTPGIYPVMVTETNPSLCDSTVIFQVMVTPRPIPLIIGPDSVCELTGPYEYSVTNILGVFQNWSISNGSNAGPSFTNPSLSVDWGAAGLGHLSLYEQIVSTGCDTTVYDTVEILSSPSPIIAGEDTVCEGDTATYCIPSSPGNIYDWVAHDGQIISSSSPWCVTVEWGITGIGMVEVSESTSFGCSNWDTLDVIVESCSDFCPSPEIAGKDTVCQWLQTTYCSPLTTNSFDWGISGGTIISGNGTDCVEVQWSQTGTNYLILSELNQMTGCLIADTLYAEVIAAPQPQLSGQDSSCLMETETYCSPVTANNFFWSVTGGDIMSGQYTNCIEVQWTEVGINVVHLEESSSESGCVCYGSSSQGVEVCDTVFVGGVDDIAGEGPRVNIWPNPSSGKFYVQVANQERKVGLFRLFDVFGKELLIREFQTIETLEIEAEILSEGFYFYEIKLDGASGFTGKLRIE